MLKNLKANKSKDLSNIEGFFQRFFKISWTGKKSNRTPSLKPYKRRQIMKSIHKRQLEFLGHIVRMSDLELGTATRMVEGRRRTDRNFLVSLFDVIEDVEF